MGNILVVDDEKSMRDFLSLMLAKEGHQVISAETGEVAIQHIREDDFDLVITDIKMPKVSGLEVLTEVMEYQPQVPVIMITAFASPETAVEAMKHGAYDYITKPFKVDEIKLVIKNALEKKRLREENIYLRRELKAKYQFSNIVGRSSQMLKVFDIIQKVAVGKSTVLISGESGTGKELVARAIHFNSPRRDKPFLSVSCGALPEPLLESELFGHEKGSFTSAVSMKKGLLEAADGGTFFLDEVGEAPPSIQVKLLRVLQEREFKRVGGTKDIKVDVRLIAATNRNLEREVANGNFREDLFYRLNVIPLELPPLRERHDDIPILINHFIKKISLGTGIPTKGVAPEARKLLESYNWPGNLRQLENVIERAMVLETNDLISVESLPDEIKNPSTFAYPSELPETGINLEEVLNEIEKDLIRKALDKAGGIKQKAAELLRLNLRSLRYRISQKLHPESETEMDEEWQDEG